MRVRATLMVLAFALGVNAASAAEDPHVGRVQAFILALSGDRSTAQAMLASGAEMGVGDVGGPLSLEIFDQLQKCTFDASKAVSKPLEMPGRKVASISVAMLCKQDETVRRQEATFLVENDQIAGFYIPVRRGND